MALLHRATLTPSKLELLTGHLATRPGTPVPAISSVASRLDGANTLIHAGDLEIVLPHLLTDLAAAPVSSLSGTWAGAPSSVILAFCR